MESGEYSGPEGQEGFLQVVEFQLVLMDEKDGEDRERGPETEIQETAAVH